MADKTFKKTVLVELNAKADAAARELERYQRELKETKFAELEAKAGTDKTKLALVAQARQLAANTRKKKQATRAAKNYAKAMKKEAHAAKEAEQPFGKLGAQMGKAAAAAGPYVAAAAAVVAVVAKVRDGLRELIKEGETWAGTVGDLSPQLERMSKASGEMFKETALSRVKKYGDELGWTKGEMDAMSKAAVHYTRTANVPLDQALKEVTDTVRGAEKEGFRKFGLTLDDLSENKTVAMGQALTALEAKFGAMAISADNASERTAVLEAKEEKLRGTLGRLIATSSSYTRMQRNEIELYKLGIPVVAAYEGKIADMSRESVMRLKALIAAARPLLKLYDKLSGKNLTGTVDLWEWQSTRRLKAIRAEQAGLKGLDAAQRQMTAINRKLNATELARLKRLRQARKGGRKAAKGDFDAHVILHRKHLAAKAKDMKAYRKKQRRMRWTSEQIERKQEAKFRKDLFAANKKQHVASVALAEKQRAKHEELAAAFLSSVGSNLAAASSGADALKKLAAAGIGALGDLAQQEAAFHFAKALAAAASFNAPGVALHTAAGVAFAALGVGAQAFAGQMGSISMGSGIDTSSTATGTSGASAASSSGGGSGSSSGGGATVTNITRVMVKGRTNLVTRKDLKSFAKRLSQGRA